MSYNLEKISDRTYRIVEADRYGQYPFLYAILGEDKCILVDTGCATGNYFAFLNTEVNKKNLPYLVVCSHVHFDHVGGNYQFQTDKCLGICMGSYNKTFSQNVEINSLALAHHGAKVLPFTVTRWVQDGDFIYLDDNNKSKELSLEVITTPGHTPDSIALYAHFEKRLFVGDNIYPYTAIHLDCLGSNVNEYKKSIKKLIDFVANVSGTNIPNQKSNQSSGNELLNTLGMTRDEVNFSPESLIEFCDGSIEEAINFYFTSPDDVASLCPRVAIQEASKESGQNEVKLSCGHVEANLSSSCLEVVLNGINSITSGILPASFIDQGYGEFSVDSFTFLVSMKDIVK